MPSTCCVASEHTPQLSVHPLSLSPHHCGSSALRVFPLSTVFVTVLQQKDILIVGVSFQHLGPCPAFLVVFNTFSLCIRALFQHAVALLHSLPSFPPVFGLSAVHGIATLNQQPIKFYSGPSTLGGPLAPAPVFDSTQVPDIRRCSGCLASSGGC